MGLLGRIASGTSCNSFAANIICILSTFTLHHASGKVDICFEHAIVHLRHFSDYVVIHIVYVSKLALDTVHLLVQLINFALGSGICVPLNWRREKLATQVIIPIFLTTGASWKVIVCRWSLLLGRVFQFFGCNLLHFRRATR